MGTMPREGGKKEKGKGGEVELEMLGLVLGRGKDRQAKQEAQGEGNVRKGDHKDHPGPPHRVPRRENRSTGSAHV